MDGVPPVVSERVQSTALDIIQRHYLNIMMNIKPFVSARHAGGVARAGWEALYLSEFKMRKVAYATKLLRQWY